MTDMHTQILKELYKNHKKLGVNPQNALEVAKKIAIQEKNRLKDILKR